VSGHSKWATTKRKKEAIDNKRGKIFSKLSKVISVAARGGSDPGSNPSLRVAIDNAKSASMPKENIERAISKGSGDTGGGNYEEIIYEAFGLGGSAILIECLTDNKNRALTEVKTVLKKLGGRLASSGSVSYQFKKKGEIVVSKENNDKNSDQIEEIIIESGASDYQVENDEILIQTKYQDLHNVQKSIVDSGVKIESAELLYNSSNMVELDDADKSKAENLLLALEDLDDVNKIYSNIEL